MSRIIVMLFVLLLLTGCREGKETQATRICYDLYDVANNEALTDVVSLQSRVNAASWKSERMAEACRRYVLLTEERRSPEVRRDQRLISKVNRHRQVALSQIIGGDKGRTEARINEILQPTSGQPLD